MKLEIISALEQLNQIMIKFNLEWLNYTYFDTTPNIDDIIVLENQYVTAWGRECYGQTQLWFFTDVHPELMKYLLPMINSKENFNLPNVTKVLKLGIDIWETAQVIPMKKRGHFTSTQNGWSKPGGEAKRSQPFAKKYSTRRAAIKRGDCYGVAAKYGKIGCSSHWW